ncbi:MAG: NAD-dependent epimerase/dehydratase family protein [Thaumarchaeota archaeon]|nr:NAD-dependent epimerase/dehydratase family protein [Nitrososphaerota archaeon]
MTGHLLDYVITGGAGFIGSHLAKLLVKQGHRVDIVDNLSVGRLENLAEIKNKIRFHNVDICNGTELRQVIAGKDGIFHHAALTSVPESYTKEKKYFDVNVHGTENVFDVAHETGTKVVFASSAGVYGDTKAIPTPESAKLEPINPYGITKLKAELLAEKYGTKHDIVGLRYYNVYGSNSSMQAGVISKFYQNVTANKPPVIEGDGKQLRDFVFVDDIAQVTIFAMEKKTGSVFINVGSGVTVSILDLANLFIKYSKKNLMPVFETEQQGNVRASQADISLAKRLLSWQPETTLEQWIQNIFKK